jgi:hypothetical protein
MNTNSNPISLHAATPGLFEEDPDEDLSLLMSGIQEVRDMWVNTWYQIVALFIANLLPKIEFRRESIYEINEDTGEVYEGPERRKSYQLRAAASRHLTKTYQAVRYHMMPRTLKVKPIKSEVA